MPDLDIDALMAQEGIANPLAQGAPKKENFLSPLTQRLIRARDQFPEISKKFKELNDEVLKSQSADLQQEKFETKPQPPSQLAAEADVKQLINDIIASGEALSTFKTLEGLKKNVNTGPWAGEYYGSQVPQFDATGNAKPPGLLQKIMTGLRPEETKNMRLLDAAIQGFSKYAFTQGGKQLTGAEKQPIFSQAPTRFDDDPTFDAVLSQGRGEFKKYVLRRVNQLTGLGYKEDDVWKIVSDEMKALGKDTSGDIKSFVKPTQPQLPTTQLKPNHRFNPVTGQLEEIP